MELTAAQNLLNEICLDWLCFCFLNFPFHLLAMIIGCVVIAFWRKPSSSRLERALRFNLFVVLLMVVSSLFSLLWSGLIWHRYYVSTDYLSDFFSFWPITQARIDQEFGDRRGYLIGVSLFQLQLIWFVFAAVTWAVTVILYRTITRGKKRQRAGALQDASRDSSIQRSNDLTMQRIYV